MVVLRDILTAVWRKAQSDGGLSGLVLYAFLVVHAVMWAVLMWVVVPLALLRWVWRW